jgi:hypothetical protein
MVKKSEYSSILKDAVMVCVEVLFCSLPGESEEAQDFNGMSGHVTCSQDIVQLLTVVKTVMDLWVA